ncbi:uncharacterized protein BYT42DRAFT_610550 [Radiomyces spectabilis]|uniref:uncharacterized protein n=1 Tax=Radiomyces spectabilis TaxID=64574 RepID=UPI00221E6293|nr:uncharacterized protein BYT42DRAFT_610550 [Radiomyces spectabilis]KAI8391307.1 hypothetical protein BYT42DRAFT_610550 [Radiomyces spectabilis]
MRFQLIFLSALFAAVFARPELEEDPTEFDVSDCRWFGPGQCVQKCPPMYGAYIAANCTGEEEHSCCDVQCCLLRNPSP